MADVALIPPPDPTRRLAPAARAAPASPDPLPDDARRMASTESTSVAPYIRRHLPALFCRALGGSLALTPPVTEAWNTLYEAIAEIDGFIDGDRQLQGDDPSCLAARVQLNEATGRLLLASHALLALHELGLETATVVAIQHQFHHFARRIGEGQHRDITCTTIDLAQAWEIVAIKSGTCYELATWSGARLATANPARLELARQIGTHLGILLQISDDYWDLWGQAQGRSDIRAQKRSSLPIAYSLTVMEEGARAQLQRLLQAAATDESAEQEARQMILAAGAALYLSVKSRSHALEALALWQRLEPIAAAEPDLGHLLDKLILQPIR